jgi:hypothetical protein
LVGDSGVGRINPNQSTTIPLSAAGLDNTRVGALVNQTETGTCVGTLVTDPNTGLQVMQYSLDNTHATGTPVFQQTHVLVGGVDRIVEVPKTSDVLSRRDLEGFTHSSLGYSFQSVSSLNCGVSGCYDTGAPAKGQEQRLTTLKNEVFKCNTAVPPFTSALLKCKGPGIELAEPAQWSTSYYLQNNQKIFNDGTKVGDITQPQYNSFGQFLQDILRSINIAFTPDPNASTGDLLQAALSLVGQVGKLFDLLNRIIIPTVSSKYFPYSILLNNRFRGDFHYNLENRPSNDSYANTPGRNECISSEMDRQSTSQTGMGHVAEYPFKACYGAVFLGQDAYSTQKALYTTTKNTGLAVSGSAIDPVVSKFLMPGEEVGEEVSFTGTIPSSVKDLPKVGKGYWRIGTVNTTCTFGTGDEKDNKQIEYPVLAIYGAEGELRAK